MYLMRISIVVLVLLASALSATAQTISVSGRVTHELTETPLARVPVYLLGTTLAAFTDSSGFYAFDQVPVGTYDLVAVVPEYGQYKDILQVTGDAEMVYDIAISYSVDVAKGWSGQPESSTNKTSTLSDTAPDETSELMAKPETVCSCYESAVSILDQAMELRSKFATEAAFSADAEAGDQMNSLLGEWHHLQRQCLMQFGTKLFEESACNNPSEISRKRQALSDIGIRS